MIIPARPNHDIILAYLQLVTSETTYSKLTGTKYFTSTNFERRKKIWREIITSKKDFVFLYSGAQGFQGYVAFAETYEGDENKAELSSIYVLKQSWGSGIGRELAEFSISRLRRAKPKKPIYLWVYEDNQKAIRFYEHNNFKKTGKRKNTNDGLIAIEMVNE